MNSTNLRLAAYAVFALFAVALMIVWGIFAFDGKTDVASFIAEIKDLLGMVIALVLGLGGFHAAVASKSTDSPASAATLGTFIPNDPEEPSTPAVKAAPTVVVQT